MNLIFTICSNNYLAQAKVFTDSIALYEPGAKIIIGLIDELNIQIDYNFFTPAEIIPLKELQIENISELFEKYNIVELNTAVKASYFKYLSVKYPEVKKIIYFDPDIKIFQSLNSIFNELNTSDIILTPHILTPIELDGSQPQENLFLKHGIYNLGFIGIRSINENVKRFLNWWEDRILYRSFTNMPEGFFVDQLPINLAPIFFNNVKILEGYGYNMAPWNLHERKLVSAEAESYTLQDGSPLYFYHFSSYDYKRPEELCKPYYSRFTFNDRPDLIKIYKTYQKDIINNRVSFFEDIPCSLLIQPKMNNSTVSIKEKLTYWVRQFIPPIFGKLKQRLFNN